MNYHKSGLLLFIDPGSNYNINFQAQALHFY